MRLNKLRRRFDQAAAAVMSVLFVLTGSFGTASAETTEYTYRSDETGAIQIHYFDDSEMKVPVDGSKWALVKVADILTDVEENSEDGLYIKSFIPDFDITSNTVATLAEYPGTNDIMTQFKWEKETESELHFSGELKNGTKLETVYGTTDKNGQLVFGNLSEGVYLGVEIEATEYHLMSDPFLVSIPYTDDQIIKPTKDILSSHMIFDINPKPYLAGHLKIQKSMPAGHTIDNEPFTFVLTLPTGRYAAVLPDGTKTVLDITNEKNGKDDHAQGTGKYIQKFKPEQTMTIYDLPIGSRYVVEEAEANTMDYITTYERCEDRIDEKTTNVATVINSLNLGGLDTLAYNSTNGSGDYGYDIIYPEKNVQVSDKVTYLHLVPGQTYTIKGWIKVLDQWGNDTGEVAATATKTFTAAASNGNSTAGGTSMGYVTQTFNFDATNYNEKKLVIYEVLYEGTTERLSHCDPGDEDQQIIVSKDSSRRRRRVRTGAGWMLIYGGIGVIASLAVIVALLLRRRRKGKKQDDKNDKDTENKTADSVTERDADSGKEHAG